MSRIGKKPVPLSDKVKVDIKDGRISVKGPKGTLDRELHSAVSVKVTDNVLEVKLVNENDKGSVALQGLYRSLIANMVTGVTDGYEKQLLLSGIGYRAEVSGKKLTLTVGYSNPVEFTLPQEVEAKVESNTKVILTGVDKEIIGQTAANIRSIRPPEPYKGKGIMYADERIIRKAGKTAGKE